MKTSEPKTASVTSQAKVNQPFFSKEGEGSFFGESVNKESSFFKPSSAYRVNSNGVLQTKLAIGQPNDKYEKEADTMADKVVQRLVTQEPITKKEPAIQTKPLAKTITPLVQPKCAACEQEEKLQKKDEEDLAQELPLELRREPIFESNAEPPDDNSPSVGKSYAEALQRKCAECEKEEKLQTKSDTSGEVTASHNIENNLNASKGSGSPLPAATREQMESSFGADFSNVRLHIDSAAVQMNKDLHAQAFTHGSDIYFNSGKYNTSNTSGKHLLAHELTHTMQQGATGIQKKAVPDVQKQSPPDNLTRLNEMLDQFNVPEEDVITLCGQLTDPEKTTVILDSTYKTRMANALNVEEMTRAVNHLGMALNKKLEWIYAATTFGTTFLKYSEIKGVITGTPQQERNALKASTTVGKDFFIGVCDNTTIVEALDDLQYDLVTKLTWLKAEMSVVSAWSYSTIKPWIIHANTTQVERDSLKTNTEVGKDFFVAVCDNETMIEALNDLQYDLVTKLTWLKAEMSVVSAWSYSTIKPWITHASTTQVERDSLKTNTEVGKDFFVAICDNSTIITAVTDLQFDYRTRIDWSRAEGVTLEMLVILHWYFAEVAVAAADYVWLCDQFKLSYSFPAGEDTIACAIMERDIRDALFDTSTEHRPPAWITRAHSQKLVADQMGGMVGEQSTWKPSWQNSGTTFAQWARTSPQGPTPALGSMLVINCWEMVMLAAFKAGVLTWARIHNIYTAPGGPAWGSFLVTQLSFNNRIPYNVAAPASRPVAGDIVFFDGPAHIALATGTVDGVGRTLIYSFWPPPNTAFTAGGTLDDVKITTIEELNDYWVAAGKPAFVIEYTTPNW